MFTTFKSCLQSVYSDTNFLVLIVQNDFFLREIIFESISRVVLKKHFKLYLII